MYQYLTDFHGKSQLFRIFCTEKYVAQIFLETYSSLYLPLHGLLRKQRNGSIAP